MELEQNTRWPGSPRLQFRVVPCHSKFSLPGCFPCLENPPFASNLPLQRTKNGWRGEYPFKLGRICLPVCPVFIPDAWGGYDPVHHPYFRWCGGMRPCSVKLVYHYTLTMLAQYPTISNAQLTCPICSVVLRQGENKGAVTDEICIARSTHG